MTSKTLFKFAETYPEVLKNPESILGPNHSKVFELWRRIDTFTYQDIREIVGRFDALNPKVQIPAFYSAKNAATEVVDEKFEFAAWLAAYVVTGGEAVFGYATEELIGGIENPIFYTLIKEYQKSTPSVRTNQQIITDSSASNYSIIDIDNSGNWLYRISIAPLVLNQQP